MCPLPLCHILVVYSLCSQVFLTWKGGSLATTTHLQYSVDNMSFVFSSLGIKQKWVPMDIEHPKSRTGRRSRSAGRSPRTEQKTFDKKGRAETGRFSEFAVAVQSTGRDIPE